MGGRLKRTMAKLDNLSDKIKDGGSMCCIVFLVGLGMGEDGRVCL